MQNSRITCQREDFDADSLLSVTTYINKSYCNFHGLYMCIYVDSSSNMADSCT